MRTRSVSYLKHEYIFPGNRKFSYSIHGKTTEAGEGKQAAECGVNITNGTGGGGW